MVDASGQFKQAIKNAHHTPNMQYKNFENGQVVFLLYAEHLTCVCALIHYVQHKLQTPSDHFWRKICVWYFRVYCIGVYICPIGWPTVSRDNVVQESVVRKTSIYFYDC